MVVRIKISATTATTAAAMVGTLRLEPAVVVTLFEPEPGVVVTAGKRVSTVLDKVVFFTCDTWVLHNSLDSKINLCAFSTITG